MATNYDNPSIYVADLKAYNEGKLIGEWVDLTEFDEGYEVMEKISDLMDGYSKKYHNGMETEYAIHDFENFSRELYSESMGEEDFDIILKTHKISEERDIPAEVLQDVMARYDSASKDIETFIDDRYRGQFDTETDFAYDYIDMNGGIENLGKDTIDMYFDYASFGSDYVTNYIDVVDGHYFDSSYKKGGNIKTHDLKKYMKKGGKLNSFFGKAKEVGGKAYEKGRKVAHYTKEKAKEGVHNASKSNALGVLDKMKKDREVTDDEVENIKVTEDVVQDHYNFEPTPFVPKKEMGGKVDKYVLPKNLKKKLDKVNQHLNKFGGRSLTEKEAIRFNIDNNAESGFQAGSIAFDISEAPDEYNGLSYHRASTRYYHWIGDALIEISEQMTNVPYDSHNYEIERIIENSPYKKMAKGGSLDAQIEDMRANDVPITEAIIQEAVDSKYPRDSKKGVSEYKRLMQKHDKELTHHSRPFTKKDADRMEALIKTENYYAEGGNMASLQNPMMENFHRNIMGTLSFDMQVKPMRKAQDFIVYPMKTLEEYLHIQSNKKFGYIRLADGKGILSKGNGNTSWHLRRDMQIGNVIKFELTSSQLEELKFMLKQTSGSKVGSSVVFSDNSGVSMLERGGRALEPYFDATAYEYRHNGMYGDSKKFATEKEAIDWGLKQFQSRKDDVQKVEIHRARPNSARGFNFDKVFHIDETYPLGRRVVSRMFDKGGLINKEFLSNQTSDYTNRILQSIADYYGTTKSKIQRELYDEDAEMIYEYIGNDRGLRKLVYDQMESFKYRNNYAKGGNVGGKPQRTDLIAYYIDNHTIDREPPRVDTIECSVYVNHEHQLEAEINECLNNRGVYNSKIKGYKIVGKNPHNFSSKEVSSRPMFSQGGNISESDWERYVATQKDGSYNMFDSRAIQFANDLGVADSGSLDKGKWSDMMQNYDEYAEKWGLDYSTDYFAKGGMTKSMEVEEVMQDHFDNGGSVGKDITYSATFDLFDSDGNNIDNPMPSLQFDVSSDVSYGEARDLAQRTFENGSFFEEGMKAVMTDFWMGEMDADEEDRKRVEIKEEEPREEFVPRVERSGKWDASYSVLCDELATYEMGGEIVEEYSIRTDFSDEDFDNEQDAREFWEDLSQEERDSGQFFRKVWIDGEEDEVELLYAKGGSMASGGELIVLNSSWFDTNKYDSSKMISALESIGAKNIYLEQDRGWSNQPEVVVFSGVSKSKAEDKLNEVFDTQWISVGKKDWSKGGSMASGGSVQFFKSITENDFNPYYLFEQYNNDDYVDDNVTLLNGTIDLKFKRQPKSETKPSNNLPYEVKRIIEEDFEYVSYGRMGNKKSMSLREGSWGDFYIEFENLTLNELQEIILPLSENVAERLEDKGIKGYGELGLNNYGQSIDIEISEDNVKENDEYAKGGSIKGRNNKSGESFGVVIGSKEFTDDNKDRISLNVRSSYSSRISERKLIFDTNGNLIETLDYGYTLDGSYPNTNGGSGRHIGASNKKETIDAMVELGYNKGFANKVIEFVKE